MTLPKEKIEYFKEKLIAKKADLEKELGNVGRPNVDAPGDWEATPAETNAGISDKNELADSFEDLESRRAVERVLEEHLTWVKKALERVEGGNYGVCEECGENIDEKRLEAFPSAKNCIKHSKNHK